MKELQNEKYNKVILLGIDGMDPVFLKGLIKKGLLKNFKKIMQEGFFTEALPSFTAKTPQNWTTIATGAEPGNHSHRQSLLIGETAACKQDFLGLRGAESREQGADPTRIITDAELGGGDRECGALSRVA